MVKKFNVFVLFWLFNWKVFITVGKLVVSVWFVLCTVAKLCVCTVGKCICFYFESVWNWKVGLFIHFCGYAFGKGHFSFIHNWTVALL